MTTAADLRPGQFKGCYSGSVERECVGLCLSVCITLHARVKPRMDGNIVEGSSERESVISEGHQCQQHTRSLLSQFSDCLSVCRALHVKVTRGFRMGNESGSASRLE